MLAAGARVGPYEVVAPLGAGGMGEVYRARDLRLQRAVAIKILPERLALDPDRRARFEREAQLLASLNHPNIAAIYGFERFGSQDAIAMELVEGPTLAARIGRGRLPIAEALALARQIATALDAAHERGIVHRDLKPSNIKLAADGTVKVLDFGLAKAVGGGALAPELTESPTLPPGDTAAGVMLGTATYMSPEQVRGQAVDKRTDLWAFGCVLFELLTGRQAFPGGTLSDVLAAILTRQPNWSALPSETPPSIHRLLRRTLEKDAGRRIRDAADARLEIDDALAGDTRADSLAPASRRRRVLAAAAVAVLVGLVVGLVGLAMRWPADARRPGVTRAIRLTNSPAQEFGPAIAPDGRWVAYLSNARGPTDIWVRFLDTGATLNLTASLSLEIQGRASIGGLDISPDGSAIAFAAREPPARVFDAWVIPAPIGGQPRKLLPGLQAMRWSPDGRRLAAIRPGASRGDTLLVANSDGSDLRVLLPVQGGRHIHFPAWSADGQFLYFIYTYDTWHVEPSEIYRVRAGGGDPELVVGSNRRAVYPAPTAGGGLVYASNPNSVDAGLWVQGPGESQAQPLTAAVGEHSDVRFSADGRRMVATLSTMKQALVSVSVPDGRVRPITDGYGGDTDPAVSPAGERLVFSSSRSGNRNLWTMRPDGTQLLPLTAENALDERPAFSADGRQIAFVSDRGGERGVWVLSAEGGAPRQLARVMVLDILTWHPDGSRILFARPGGELPRLATIAVADGRIEPFATPGAAHAPAWSPRGDRIAFLEPTTDVPSQTWVAFVDSQGRRLYPALPRAPQSFQNGLLAWDRSGRRLCVLSMNANLPAALWIVDPESTQPYRRLAEFPIAVRRIHGLTWTFDGSAVLASVEEAVSDVVLYELDAVTSR